MMRTLKALAACLTGAVLSPTPATAAPNVFWTFGFDRHYAHGTGGRVELPAKIMMASVLAAGGVPGAPTATLAAISLRPDGEREGALVPDRASDGVSIASGGN